MGTSTDYSRILFLNNKIKGNTASKNEKDEYMQLLYKNGNITKKQLDDYYSSQSIVSNDTLEAALVIGGIVLLGYLLSEAFKK